MTLQEIMEISKSCRTTTSRKIKKLREQGYVERGCGDWQAYTYYITEKGLKLIKDEEEKLACGQKLGVYCQRHKLLHKERLNIYV